MPAQSVPPGTVHCFIIHQSISDFYLRVHTQQQVLPALRILFQTHLQLLEGWENYLIISSNNCICFTTFLLDNCVSGQILASLRQNSSQGKKLRDSRTEKGQEETNLVHEELPTKLQDSQTQAVLHLIIFHLKNQYLVPLHSVALHKESRITAEDCGFLLKDSLQV